MPSTHRGADLTITNILLLCSWFRSPPLTLTENKNVWINCKRYFSNQDVVINSDPFFPSVSSNHVREVLRLDSSVTNQRLISAIEAAVIHVNEQLESLLSKAPTLVEITTKQVNGKPIAAVLYFRAVAAAAGAELCERYRSYDTTNNGSQKLKN